MVPIMLTATYTIPVVPPPEELETVALLKALVRATHALVEFKGRAATIPNQDILIGTCAFGGQSRVGNREYRHDAGRAFQADLFPEGCEPVPPRRCRSTATP